MRQRLDIADVEERTKIRAKYLRALENEEFAMLPGPTFVKTFLRTYAEQLGLDPHMLVEEYRADYERDEELELQPLGPPAMGPTRGRGRRVGPGVVALLVVVAIVGALVAIGLISGDDESSGDQAGRTETTAERTTTRPKQKKAAPPKQVKLRVVPSTATYVCVDHGVGSDVVFEGTIDTAQTYRGKHVRVLLGKRDLQLWKNGKQVQVAPGADPIAFAFGPRRTQELPNGTGPCI